MTKVYCLDNHGDFKKGTIYYSNSEKLWSGGTYALMYIIYDMSHNKIGDIGYLYDSFFEPLDERRKKIIGKLLNEEV